MSWRTGELGDWEIELKNVGVGGSGAFASAIACYGHSLSVRVGVGDSLP